VFYERDVDGRAAEKRCGQDRHKLKGGHRHLQGLEYTLLRQARFARSQRCSHGRALPCFWSPNQLRPQAAKSGIDASLSLARQGPQRRGNYAALARFSAEQMAREGRKSGRIRKIPDCADRLEASRLPTTSERGHSDPRWPTARELGAIYGTRVPM